MKVLEMGNETYFIGENAQDNHEMFDKMSGEMTWFHLDNSSSTHVYVKVPKERNSRKMVIKQAAYYVRFYSKNYGKVCYTKKSNLQKGEKPGEVVILDEEKLKLV